MRAGQYVKQPSGYRAFIPSDLPPDPPIQYDGELLSLSSKADRALGRLDGIATIWGCPGSVDSFALDSPYKSHPRQSFGSCNIPPPCLRDFSVSCIKNPEPT